MAKKAGPKKRRVRVTSSFQTFLSQTNSLLGFIAFTWNLATRADEVSKTAAKALLSLARNPEEIAKYEKSAKDGAGAAQHFRNNYADLLRETTLCRGVDNYLAYITNLLIEIHRSRHELLKSDEKITYQEVVEAGTREELIDALIDRRVHELSYLGFRRLNEELKKRFKYSLIEQSADVERTDCLVELRNLFVHANGVVGRRFARRVPKYAAMIGKKISLDATLVDDLMFLMLMAMKADKRAVSKFKLANTVLASTPTQNSLLKRAYRDKVADVAAETS